MGILNPMLTTYSESKLGSSGTEGFRAKDIPCERDLRLCGNLGQKWRGYLLQCMNNANFITKAEQPARVVPAQSSLRNGGNVPVLSCSWSSLSPRSATFVMLSRMIPTVSSIWAWIAAVLGFPPPGGLEEEPPPRGR